jgi:hypothetical protein
VGKICYGKQPSPEWTIRAGGASWFGFVGAGERMGLVRVKAGEGWQKKKKAKQTE